MPHRSYDELDDQDIEDLGVFEYLDDEAPHFVPAPPPPAPQPRLPPEEEEFLHYRLRVELPMLWAWITISALFMTPWAWLLAAGGLIAANLWLRPAYALYGLHWLGRVYIAAAVGQILAVLSQVADLGPLKSFLGPYAAALLLVWIVLELRYQLHVPQRRPPQTEEDQLYYFYG